MADYSRASSLHGFANFARQQGIDPEAQLARVGLSLSLLESPESIIEFSSLAMLLENCAEASGDSLFGLKFGQYQGVDIFGPLLYLIQNAATVGLALEELAHHFSAHSSSAVIDIERGPRQAFLSYTMVGGGAAPGRQISELPVGVGQRLLSLLLGPQWRPRAIYLATSPSVPALLYQRLLGVVPTFNSPSDGWLLECSDLERPLVTADGRLHRLMEQYLTYRPEQLPQDLVDEVSWQIRQQLGQGGAGLDDIARRLALNPRTLQRRLATRGRCFQDLVDEVRRQLAIHYLRETSLPLTDIANLLGYSELSALTRGCRRWFGVAPSRWRQHQRRRSNGAG
ncbi:AraC family transcriptional regulator [Halomonas sp.]|uniref:AraC family transcriptional regulator n=1 Tax=Halomonas sp. TaxID=1486246 RepID=UPI00257C98D0|nr:AraC family transcriptional regulator [Halomonas sp.]MCJ8284615.1 AraC family transcriptional regulator [Halomonas sp.]NQY69669.1 AraC family transcriptional regulator [Halomonas sp.]